MQRLRTRIAAGGAHAARTVVLLPYAQLMPVARQSWARQQPTGFAPKFETTMNWSRQGRWAPADLGLSFEMGRDLLSARVWLEQAAALRGKADLLAGRLVEAAWQAAAAARAVPPARRAAWAGQLRMQLLVGLEGPALATEAAIAGVAFEWAAASSYASDALLDGSLTRDTDLLVVLEGLQVDPVARALLDQLGERAVAWPLPQPGPPGRIAILRAADAADEAERAAACVLRHLAQGRTPVALGATDRVLTRRVGALLATRGVPVRDETGWKLSTTRAAAHVMTALRAMAWDASCDAVLDWLKNADAWRSGLVQRMERQVRRAAQREWRLLRTADWGEAGATSEAAQRIDELRAAQSEARPLLQWLAACRELLEGGGQWSVLRNDAAGLRVIEALRLEPEAAGEWDDWPQGQRRMTQREFVAWANEVLEAVSFVPPHSGQEQVVVLPMSQLLGHPFAALVLPGCDERNLPAAPEPPAAWTRAQRKLLGLPSRDDLEAVQRGAWQQALQLPHCDLLWRGSDDSGEPMLASPLLQALQLAHGGETAGDPREPRPLQAQEVVPPAALAADLVPTQLSASSYEDLRRCPYRFFALRMLGLREADEIEAEVDKRDFGNWLHNVLKAFHEQLRERGEASRAERVAMLDALAQDGMARQRLGEGEFLPFAAGWPGVRDGYLAWLQRHEATGASYHAGESRHTIPLGPLTLEGRIDRIDRAGGGMHVMDYKTESLQTTKDRMKQPLEDTQLAFYAALLAEDELQAAYLNISERGEVVAVPHTEVGRASQLLKDAIVSDMRRLGQGATLGALGEGKVCEYCAARGLCRRDAWSE